MDFYHFLKSVCQNPIISNFLYRHPDSSLYSIDYQYITKSIFFFLPDIGIFLHKTRTIFDEAPFSGCKLIDPVINRPKFNDKGYFNNSHFPTIWAFAA